MTRTLSMLGALALTAPSLTAQHVRTLESARLLTDAGPVAVRLHLGTGTLSVGAGDAPFLYRSITRFGDSYTAPRSTWNASQRTLTLTTGQRAAGTRPRGDAHASDGAAPDWRVQLTRRAPVELTIDATAADATLDLTGIPLRRFALNSGASAATVRFDAPNPESMAVFDANVGAGGLKLIGIGNAAASEMRIVGKVGDIALDLGGRWQRDLRVSVSSIVGGISITAPSTIGIELESSGVLSRDKVQGSFSRAGDTWRSTNYEQSSVKVRLSVRSLLGTVTLIQR